MWVLLHPTRTISESAVRQDLQFFVLIREDLRQSNHLKISFIAKAALSSQSFKDPECWSGRGSYLRPPAQQTGANPMELTWRRLAHA